jgi:hypothetical protein
VAPARSGRCAGDAAPPSAERALNSIAEHLDYGRRDTTRTNQIKRSFGRFAQAAGARAHMRGLSDTTKVGVTFGVSELGSDARSSRI